MKGKVRAVIGNLELVEVNIRDLQAYDNNPRIIEDAIPQVMESIRQCGYITPIVCDEDGVILAGHTRFEALKELGEKRCEVLVATGLTDEQKRKYRILDNKTGELATWDNLVLKNELQGIDFEGFDFGQPIVFEEHEQTERPARTVICPRCKAEVRI